MRAIAIAAAREYNTRGEISIADDDDDVNAGRLAGPQMAATYEEEITPLRYSIFLPVPRRLTCRVARCCADS